MTKLIDIIRSALNEVSCEELPSGCDDLSVEMADNGNHDPIVSNYLYIYYSSEEINHCKWFMG